jgi:hypothetical protein
MRGPYWLALGVLLVTLAPSAADEPGDTENKLMRAKLKFSEQVLTGLVNKDFDAIREGADHLGKLGQLERWSRAFTPEYKAQLAVYRSANNDLVRMAGEENLDGAALAFMQLTLSCVNCHKVIRDSAERP